MDEREWCAYGKCSSLRDQILPLGIATFAIFTGSIANGGGMHRTNDSGTTWLIGNSGMSSNAIAYDIATNGRIFMLRQV